MLKERVKVLHQSLSDALKRRGYQKQTNLYVRPVGDLLHMIDVQHSRRNDGNCHQFTLNCGVYVPGVTSTFWNTPDPKRPKLTDCCVSIRVGMLTPSRLDIWWEVRADDPIEKDAQTQTEIISTVTEFALPFVERFQREPGIAQFLTEERTKENKLVEPRADAIRLVYAAILWKRLGEANKCSSCIEEAIRRAKTTPLELVVSGFATRFR